MISSHFLACSRIIEERKVDLPLRRHAKESPTVKSLMTSKAHNLNHPDRSVDLPPLARSFNFCTNSATWFYDRFLVAHCLMAKRPRKCPSLSHMILVRRRSKTHHSRHCLFGADMYRISIQMRTNTIDIPPGFGRVKRELIWHNTNDWTVSVMKSLVVEMYASFQERDDGWQRRHAPHQRAGKSC